MGIENNNSKSDTPQTKINPASIYPAPEFNINSQADTSKMNDSMPTKGFGKQFLSTFSKFLVGLAGIGILGFLLGLITKGPVVHATGYFSELANYLAILYYLAPLTVFFSIVAYVKKDIMFAAYPILIYIFGKSLINLDLINLVRDYLPYITPERSFDYFKAAIASATVFMALYAFERPLIHLIRTARTPPPQAKRQQLIYGIIFTLMILVAILLPKAARSLYASQQRTRATIHVPDTEQMIGRPLIGPYRDSNTFGDVAITYAEATVQHEGTYQQADELRITPLTKWWVRDMHSNCGKGKSVSYFPGQVGAYEYKATAKNIKYAETSFNGNRSNPPKDSTAYVEYHYCFVLGYHMYILVRNNDSGKAYLEKYPAKDVIDAITQGQRYVPFCVDKGEFSKSYKFLTPFYCRHSDTDKLSQLIEKAHSQYTAQPPVSKTTGIISPTINKSAYGETGRLTINEWGISLPLTDDIKDAYYVPRTPSSAENIFTISLKSYDTDACFAGIRKDSAGRNISGYGMAFISRHKASEIKTTGETSITGTTIGEYVYSLSANGNIQKCMDSLQKDTLVETRLVDIFDWSEAGIR